MSEKLEFCIFYIQANLLILICTRWGWCTPTSLTRVSFTASLEIGGTEIAGFQNLVICIENSYYYNFNMESQLLCFSWFVFHPSDVFFSSLPLVSSLLTNSRLPNRLHPWHPTSCGHHHGNREPEMKNMATLESIVKICTLSLVVRRERWIVAPSTLVPSTPLSDKPWLPRTQQM